MNSIFLKAGLLAIVFLVIYMIKKIDDYFFNKKIGINVSDKIYRAARAFAQGESTDEIKKILINCIDFDEEDIDEVLSLSRSHRTDNDGGYQAFLEAAKKVLANY